MRLIQGQAERFGDVGVDTGTVGAGIEHQAKRPFGVDIHGRPDPPDTIAPRWRDESRLGRLHDDFRQLLRLLIGRRRALRLERRVRSVAAAEREQGTGNAAAAQDVDHR